MKKILIILFVGFLLVGSVSAVTYYVSNSGNDANSGTSESSPWKTISKVNGFALQPGDTVLFKRGDLWREELHPSRSGTASARITYDAYGTGDKPKIFRSYPISGTWSNQGNNVWRLSYTTGINQIFLQRNNNYDRGNLRSSASALTAHKDWYRDSNYLYIYSPSDPLTYFQSIEGLEGTVSYTHESGIRIDANYITIKNFEVAFASDANIGSHGFANIIIDGVETHHSGTSYDGTGQGIALRGMDNIIRNSQIYEHGEHCIYIFSYEYQAGNTLIENNSVYNCYHTHIDIMASTHDVINVVVNGNRVYDTPDRDGTAGSGGIQTSGTAVSSHFARNITITNNLLYFIHGQGLNLVENSDNIIANHNTIYNHQGSALWTADRDASQPPQHVSIKNNLVVNTAGTGIFVGARTNRVIDYNAYFGNTLLGYSGANYNTLSAWNSATGFDLNGYSVDPNFVDVANKDFRPKATLANGQPNPICNGGESGTYIGAFPCVGTTTTYHPADLNQDGCISLGEISTYVGGWLQGSITLSQASSAVSTWLVGCQ